MIDTLEESLLEDTSKVEKITQQNLARALQVCGDVAKLYKRKGQPPKWISITSLSNRQDRRHPPPLPVKVYRKKRGKS